MSSLLDIGPLTASVTVRGKDISVNGIGADTLVQLLSDFPEMQKYVGGGAAGADAGEMMKLGPDIVRTIMLAGTGFKKDDEKAIAVLKSLTVGEQMLILEPVLMMTFPKGFTSFVEALSRISGEGAGVADVSGRAPVTK